MVPRRPWGGRPPRLRRGPAAAAGVVRRARGAWAAADRLDAHAIALCAADAATGADVRGEHAVLALALGYASAARTLAPVQEEPSLHAFVSLDRRKLADSVRRKDASAGDRHLLLRWLVQDGDEKGLRRFIGSARDNDHVSTPAIGQFLLVADLQVVAAASEALPAVALADLENLGAKAPTDVEVVMALMNAQQSALTNLAGNEDPRARLATDLQQA